MALDLSALEDKTLPAGAESNGKPLEIALSDIEEDPNQPRIDFSQEAMAEITASIRVRGVRQPVSVRPHPTKPGKWMLNFGARRFRGSIAAEKETIPAFVDDTSEDFDQVIENEQRDNLKPMELALFIQRKLDAGVKKAEIARKLGKAAAVITEHLALISPPACIEDIYRDGKCTSPKTLYELRGLHEKHPEAVEAWCASVDDITRKAVAELSAELRGDKKALPLPAQTETSEQVQSSPASESSNSGPESLGKDEDFSKAQDTTGGAGDNSSVTALPFHNPNNEKGTKEPVLPDPNKIKKPLLLVEYDGRAAMVLLNRRPSTPGLLWIRYEDGGGDDEIDAGRCKINMLSESMQ